MKILKRILIGFGVLLALLLVTAMAALYLFKDQIVAAIDEQLDASLDADVYYDADRFSLSLFTNFPNVTASLSDFGIVNRGAFEGDTLVALDRFNIEINLFKIIGGEIKIDGITLDRPRINVIVLNDSTANYNIAKATEETPQAETETTSSGDTSFKIDHWQIIDGDVRYDDKTLGFLLDVKGLNHSGSGDFTLTVFDMATKTGIDTLTVEYGGVAYIKEKPLEAALTLGMDLDKMKFTLKQGAGNFVQLADFKLSAEGSVEVLEDRYPMAVDFGSQDNRFASLLSLVPEAYISNLADLKTDGELSFSGRISGEYSEEQMPGLLFNLSVKDGMLQYPEVPTPVNNVQLDLTASAEDGNYAQTLVEIKRLHADMGANPVDGTASFRMRSYDEFELKTDLNADVNLAEVNKIFPQPGLDMKGQFGLHAKADGVYKQKYVYTNKDTTLEIVQIPVIDAKMILKDGYVNYDSFPKPIEDMQVALAIENKTGQYNDTKAELTNASLVLDGEKFEAHGKVDQLDDPAYDFSVAGALKLDLVEQILAMDGVTLKGYVQSNLKTSGRLSYVEANNLRKMPTSGSLIVRDFEYKDTANLPQGVKIVSSDMTFSPASVDLKEFKGFLGQSDIAATGQLTNYIPFISDMMKGKTRNVLKGNLQVTGERFDVNEWMTESEEEAATPEGDEAYGVVQIPPYLDFTFTALIKEVLYTNLTLNDLEGSFTMRNSVLRMNGVRFATLGGEVGMKGEYNSLSKQAPRYDFSLNVNHMEFQKAYTSFNSVQAMAPFAQNILGDFSTEFKIAGLLDQTMSPIYDSMTGEGSLETEDAQFKDMKLMDKISSISNLKAFQDPKLKDLSMRFEIKNGRVNTREPFDLEVAGIKAKVGGSVGVDGTMDFTTNAKVPGDQIGQMGASLGLGGALGGLLNSSKNKTFDVPVDIKGTYNDPQVKIDFKSVGQQLIDSNKGSAGDKIKEGLNSLFGK